MSVYRGTECLGGTATGPGALMCAGRPSLALVYTLHTRQTPMLIVVCTAGESAALTLETGMETGPGRDADMAAQYPPTHTLPIPTAHRRRPTPPNLSICVCVSMLASQTGVKEPSHPPPIVPNPKFPITPFCFSLFAGPLSPFRREGPFSLDRLPFRRAASY